MMQTQTTMQLTYEKAIDSLRELRDNFGPYMWFSEDVDVYENSGIILESLSKERRPPTQAELEILIELFNRHAHACWGDISFELADRARDALDFLHYQAGLNPPTR